MPPSPPPPPPITATSPPTPTDTATDWFLLPSCPCILTPDRTLFHTFHTTPHPPIHTTDGLTLPVAGVGLIILRIGSDYLIQPAAYTPSATRNVLPPFVLLDGGCGVSFDFGGMNFHDPYGRIVTRAVRVGSSENTVHKVTAVKVPWEEVGVVEEDVGRVLRTMERRGWRLRMVVGPWGAGPEGEEEDEDGWQVGGNAAVRWTQMGTPRFLAFREGNWAIGVAGWHD